MNTAAPQKTLFLLTKTYPFGDGEQYITSELAGLSSAFKKIIIYPNDYYGDDLPHRKALPANAEVLNFNKVLANGRGSSLPDYWLLFKSSFAELISTDDKRSFFQNFKWNMINFWTQLKLANYFKDYIAEQGLNGSNSVFYSYWFHKSAIFLSLLKSKGVIGPYVSRAHSVDLYHNDWGIIDESCKVPPFKMFKLKHVSRLCAISEHGRLYLQQKFPEYAHKFERKYLGVSAPGQAISRDSQSDKFHIVTCSGIDYNKRVHKLAEALAQVKQPVRWTHFGTGEMLPQVLGLVKALPAHIEADLKGQQPNEVIKVFYAEHRPHLFVNLSVVEGLPVSIMEAMSFGIPALATAVYGTPEAVIEGRTGFLLDVNFSLDDLAGRINRCIADRASLEQMGQNARDLCLDRFSAEKNYTEFANYLASL